METRGVKGLHEDSDSDYDHTAFYDDLDDIDEGRTAQETKGWNLFREVPVKREVGSMVSTDWVDTSVKILKLFAYIVVFLLVLSLAVVSKGTLLFITSQLRKARVVQHCNKALALDQQFITSLTLEERVSWLWALLGVFAVPELILFLRSARIAFFKTAPKPTRIQYAIAFAIDTLHTVGIALLLLFVLPNLDVLKGAMLMNALCIVPLILNSLTRDRMDPNYFMKLVVDVLAVSAQVTAFVLWPLLSRTKALWAIPFAAIFISIGWSENFISYDKKTNSGIKILLTEIRLGLKKSRYYTQLYLTLWKILVFIVCIMVALDLEGENGFAFFSKVREAFDERTYTVHEVIMVVQDAYDGILDYTLTGGTFELPIDWSAPLWVALIQITSCYVCYAAAKFACKVLIQEFSFTFALNLVGPVTINLLIIFSGLRNGNPCAFHGTIPDYLFFEMPPVYRLGEYLSREVSWAWLLWLTSQAWAVRHAWRPRCARLAPTDKLFARPLYSGAVIDVSLLMNRSKDDGTDITVDDIKEARDSDSDSFAASSDSGVHDVKPSDAISRIYICATMWHENREEMMEFLKSIFRMDEDQSARRVAQKYLGIVDPDYYELETNIFMDDAFEVSDHSEEDTQVNRFVKCLVDTIDDAASEVHLTNVRLRPPKKYPTPYGGRLVWTLPGKTKMICHLKDKNKIRHKKRWSQAMYMYYLLGHRLMDLPITVDRKEVLAENTYLLALDGDIDFRPSAVTRLVDLMKKDKNLGAACGRVHPIGSGFMAWYQMFEYAIGHWLQKATEHMIGCVLCSPGCFSLFRGKALMDDNVMKKYTFTSTEARHFVQYDQGEDRWLCTLLLQRGYRVEYSATSDSYTHCPEAFNEFFNQRRRWIPSTSANILDLLYSAKRTVKINDNISTLYIGYQMVLMVGTALGPGTIFLMLIGAMNAITGISNYNALIYNLIPVSIFFIVCLTCKTDTQLLVATIITCLYALLMMLVLVGLVLQISEDGWLAPASIFTVATFGIFFITAALHPQEFDCLFYLLIYYITIPSMYMLLVIYAVCNLNNVSWGTREVAQKKTIKEMELNKQREEEAKKRMDNPSVASWLGKSEEESGSVEFGVAGLFKCLCCTNPKDHKEDLHFLKISHTLEKIEKRLDLFGAPEDSIETNRRASLSRRKSVRDTLGDLPEYVGSDHTDDTYIPKEERDDLVNPFWLEDPDLQKGEVDFLMTAETEFWKDVIDTYLRPLEVTKEEQLRREADLKDLRNKTAFAFMMINVLFVLVIFILQLNQDTIHIAWPFGQNIYISYDGEVNLITIDREYLLLEPIGTLVLVFFGVVMVVQFIAMIFHRMGTLTHLLATVKLNWPCMRRTEEMSDADIIEQNAIEIAKDLQKLNDDDLVAKGEPSTKVERRKTIHELEKARENRQNATANLDANFKRRLTILQNGDNSVLSRMTSLGATEATRRATLRAIQTRRESINRPSHTHVFEGREVSNLPVRKSNVAFVPARFDDSDEEMSPAPRRSTVRFRETYT